MIRKSTSGSEKPSSFQRYYEYMGGLGDVILRLFSSPWYASLDRLAPGERAAVVLMSHHPDVSQLFKWHPRIAQIEVFDLGFDQAGFPWADPKYRADHHMPVDGPCPPPHDGAPINFYPSPADLATIGAFGDRQFVVMCPSAGTPERTFPPGVASEIVDIVIATGTAVVEVGSSKYLNAQYGPLPPRPGLISLVDKLSIPGTIELIRKCRGVITAHSFALHAAWNLKKPVFLLYPKWVRDVFVKHGPIGYFFGANDPGTVHAEFSSYERGLLLKWGAL